MVVYGCHRGRKCQRQHKSHQAAMVIHIDPHHEPHWKASDDY